jgi:hypothetical protein
MNRQSPQYYFFVTTYFLRHRVDRFQSHQACRDRPVRGARHA